MAPERPNFFEVLELDASVDDSEVIRARIRKKKHEWSATSLRGAGGKVRRAKYHLELLDEMTRVMSDAGGRAEERKRFTAGREQARTQALAALEEDVQRMKRRGLPATAKQIDELESAHAAELTRADIEGALQQARVRKAAESIPAGAQLELLDPAKMKPIIEQLQTIGAKDLYDFLDLSPKSSVEELGKKARDTYDLLQASGATGQMDRARNVLAGHAMHIFGDRAGKEAYDNTLATRPLRALERNVEHEEVDGSVPYATFEFFVDEAVRARVDRTLAERYFEHVLRERGWHLEAIPPVQQLKMKLRRVGPAAKRLWAALPGLPSRALGAVQARPRTTAAVAGVLILVALAWRSLIPPHPAKFLETGDAIELIDDEGVTHLGTVITNDDDLLTISLPGAGGLRSFSRGEIESIQPRSGFSALDGYGVADQVYVKRGGRWIRGRVVGNADGLLRLRDGDGVEWSLPHDEIEDHYQTGN